MKKHYAYKHGELSSGNWRWAVGYRTEARARPLQIVTVNHYACRSTERSAEETAKAIALALSLPDGHLSSIVEALRDRSDAERAQGQPDHAVISLLATYDRAARDD